MTKLISSPGPSRFDDPEALSRLKKRHAAERRFRLYGQLAISFAILFLGLLIVSIGSQAVSAFSHHQVTFHLPLNEETVAPNGPGDPEAVEENISGFYQLVREDLARTFPEAGETPARTREVNALVTRLAVIPMARETSEHLDWLGETRRYRTALSDDLDLYLKGAVADEIEISLAEILRAEQIRAEDSDAPPRIRLTSADEFASLRDALARASALTADRGEAGGFSVLVQNGANLVRLLPPYDSQPLLFEPMTGTPANLAGGKPEARIILLPESARNVTDRQIAWTLALQEQGRIRSSLNWALLTNSDSTYPEIAGVLAAIVGSLFTMFVTAAIAIPIGICAALYLEEYAPKNRVTDLIEVNINNLAAVPSIVFGLLGAAVFLNFLALPRSAPLVGGLVLGLLTLPTVIIAARAALRTVPPSIRAAALGLGASKTQTVFHHVLPLAAPGILTGAIIGMARALGETAPLLLIGMVAFVAEVPGGPTDEATALPVLIYKWSTGAERAWEPNTAAAILVLLTFMVVMNAVAVFLRRRFERRW
ncbi:MAG: phosphate ABC transporter permease PstA [Hyphomonadaceae bacterium]|nr:phosphate ABC transporter permease PstA [Hyphomonadaceae bacterium]